VREGLNGHWPRCRPEILSGLFRRSCGRRQRCDPTAVGKSQPSTAAWCSHNLDQINLLVFLLRSMPRHARIRRRGQVRGRRTSSAVTAGDRGSVTRSRRSLCRSTAARRTAVDRGRAARPRRPPRRERITGGLVGLVGLVGLERSKQDPACGWPQLVEIESSSVRGDRLRGDLTEQALRVLDRDRSPAGARTRRVRWARSRDIRPAHRWRR
jgi:hypothetical protein